ncbi:MAG: cytochrome c oxidase subunit 4 [Nocardioides sp.]|nr:cytochrome c oxidase subunit 4 [Nocardioides sp.]
MKTETWMFAACTVFLVLVTPAYWFVTSASKEGGDWTGSSALVMCTFLMLMVTLYLGAHARKMEARPEDRTDAEIADGAGEYGFFPPFSWWPLWAALAFGMVVFSVAMAAWWLVIIAAVLGFLALVGWNFEYYRGQFKH